MEIPDYAKRIEDARVRAGKSIEEACVQLGISYESYQDLEWFDDEILTCISIRQVETLCEFLNVSSVILLTGQSENRILNHITLREVLDGIRSYIQSKEISVEQFEEE